MFFLDYRVVTVAGSSLTIKLQQIIWKASQAQNNRAVYHGCCLPYSRSHVQSQPKLTYIGDPDRKHVIFTIHGNNIPNSSPPKKTKSQRNWLNECLNKTLLRVCGEYSGVILRNKTSTNNI